MNKYDTLISRLTGVRKVPLRNDLVAAHRAVCPVCGTKNWTKLSIGQMKDGRILIHCFAGCSVKDVIRSVGMDVADLMPPLPSFKNQSFKGFENGPSDWASAAALADAVAWAAVIAANEPCESNLANLVSVSNQFHRVAKRAMRGGVR